MTAQPNEAPVDAVAPEAQPVDAKPSTSDITALYKDDTPNREPVVDEPPVEDAPEPEIEAEEPDLPAIDAPASWAKDAKEKFAALPREAQEIIAGRERERDVEVRRAQSEVQTVRQRAEQEARQQVVEIQRNYATELQQYASMVGIEEPDIRLLQSNDPQHHALYNEQNRQYQLASAQRAQIMQQAQAAQQQADQFEQQQMQEARQAEHQLLTEKIPEWSDPSARQNLLAQLEPIGAELGYSRELMAQAGATDILALRTALNWKAEADKYRELMKRRMEPVRAAKQVPPAARVAAPSAPTAKPAGSLAQLYPDDMPK